MSRVVYDFTVFEDDGVTPWFGSVDEYGDVVESSFQTPDPELAHERPYLQIPEGFSPSEVDFVDGSSRIGAGSVAVMDKRLTPIDQTTGIVTSRVRGAAGRRAVLRRWVNGEWRIQFDGVVHSVSIDPANVLLYWFHLRDGREFERDRSLFFSNHVLFGADGANGPAIDYGHTPLTRWLGGLFGIGPKLLDAVGPFESIVAGGIDHFERVEDDYPVDGIYWGKAAIGNSTVQSVGISKAIRDVGSPVQDPDGIFRYRDVRIEWRPKGSEDDYTVLRAMPRAGFAPVTEYENAGSTGSISGSDPTFFGTITLYFGSHVEADVPETGQEIEFRVLAERITPETPFWWDGGTLGDLLQEIVDGEHTEEPPRERYDQAALAAFALSTRFARFRLTSPVGDRRRWVEENIFKPAFAAPALNVRQELYPASWKVPTAAELESAPIVNADTIQPVGDWAHGIDNAIGEIEFTYIREHLESEEDTLGRGTTVKQILDSVRTDRFAEEPWPWQRLVETPVTVRRIDPDAAPGARKEVYAPVTIRSIGSVDGLP